MTTTRPTADRDHCGARVCNICDAGLAESIGAMRWKPQDRIAVTPQNGAKIGVRHGA
jgi:hypothetical protein